MDVLVRQIVGVLLVWCLLDHNECASNDRACEQICHNSNNSHSCSCLSGYRLAKNNKTCEGIFTIYREIFTKIFSLMIHVYNIKCVAR